MPELVEITDEAVAIVAGVIARAVGRTGGHPQRGDLNAARSALRYVSKGLQAQVLRSAADHLYANGYAGNAAVRALYAIANEREEVA